LKHIKSEPKPDGNTSVHPDESKKRKRDETEVAPNTVEKENSVFKECHTPPDQSQVLEEHQRLLEEIGNQSAEFSAIEATNVLKGFTSKPSTTQRVTKMSHLFISPPKTNYSEIFKPDSVSKFYNQAAFESSVPMTTSFRTIQSTCPSRFSDDIPPPVQSIPTDERPPKRSKIEKIVSKLREDNRRLFENQIAIMNHLAYMSLDNQVSRNWQNNALSIRLNMPPPAPIPFQPPNFNMNTPDISSSSDASSPTAPSK
jgi:hypothetical protein